MCTFPLSLNILKQPTLYIDHVENVGVSKVDEGTAAAWNSLRPRNGFKRKAAAAMDASRQPPTHGDGLLGMRGLARTLLESMANEMMDAQADMPCEDGADARDGYRCVSSSSSEQNVQ